LQTSPRDEITVYSCAAFPLQIAARHLPDNSFLSKAVAAAKQETRKCRQIKAVCRDSKKIAETNYDLHLLHISPQISNKKTMALTSHFISRPLLLFELRACRLRRNCSALNIY